MHGHVNQEEFLQGIAGLLGWYYLSLALMNAITALYLWKTGRSKTYFTLPKQIPVLGGVGFTSPLLWLLVAVLFVFFSPIAFSGNPLWMKVVSVPEVVRTSIDFIMNPIWYTVGTLVLLIGLFMARKFFVKPAVAWSMFNLALLVMGFSMTDSDFAAIVTKPDNVPIVGLLFLLGFFTWLSASKAVVNDERAKKGLEPLEKLDNEKVLVWPDLVYIELICMVAITAFLILWGIALIAPLEEMANPVKTPNPSKAPWYFLGLQEMLVYFDPWMAGVVLPSTVVFGLMAIPYLDFNKKGNGYYTIEERKFAYLTFQFGFLVLWVTLIVMGTFFRGPNWNFFGPYENWDPHKTVALNNVDLSEVFWINLMGTSRPKAASGAGELVKFFYVMLREIPGILVLVSYFAVLPPLLAVCTKFFRNMFVKMGFIRFMVMTNLLLMMGLLPLKMACRWIFNLKYFINLAEYMFNF